MLQQEKPEDYVIATGTTTHVRDFVKMAFAHAGVSIAFEGSGTAEKGIVTQVALPEIRVSVGDVVVEVDPRYFRPTEVDLLLGDASKAKKQLGWEPKISLREMIEEMVTSDIQHFRKDVLLKDKGFRTLNRYE